jgi:histidinol-phosphate aminotransferase
VSAVSQKIAETVIAYHEYLGDILRNIKENRKSLQSNITEIIHLAKKTKNMKIYNTETNFILIEADKSNDAQKIFDFLLENKILVRNIGKGLLRITTGSRAENERLVEVFKESLENLNG